MPKVHFTYCTIVDRKTGSRVWFAIHFISSGLTGEQYCTSHFCLFPVFVPHHPTDVRSGLSVMAKRIIMRKLLLSFAILLAFTSARAQPSTYFGTYAASGLPAPVSPFIYNSLFGNETNMVYAGNETYYTGGQRDTGTFIIMKHNGNGVPVWTKTYKLDINCYMPTRLLRLSNGDLVIVYLINSTTWNFGFFKVDKDGVFKQCKHLMLPGAFGSYSSSATNDAGFIISGSGCAGNNPVIRIDSTGNVLWAKDFWGSGKNVGGIYTADGVYFDLFSTYDASSTCLASLTRIDKNGTAYTAARYDFGDPANQVVLGTVVGSRTKTTKRYWVAASQNRLNEYYISCVDDITTLNWARKITFVDYTIYPGFNWVGSQTPEVVGTSDGGALLIAQVVDPTDTIGHTLYVKFDSVGTKQWNLIAGKSKKVDTLTENKPISALFNTVDSTVILNSSFGSENNVFRVTENGTGLCYSANYPIVVANLPLSLVHATITTSILSVTATPKTLLSTTPVTVTISYTCEDTMPSVINPPPPTHTHQLAAGSNISVFPNPARDVVHFSGAALEDVTNIVLYNAVGSKVKEVAASANATDVAVSTEGLAAGMYIYKVSNEQGPIAQGTVLLQGQ